MKAQRVRATIFCSVIALASVTAILAVTLIFASPGARADTARFMAPPSNTLPPVSSTSMIETAAPTDPTNDSLDATPALSATPLDDFTATLVPTETPTPLSTADTFTPEPTVIDPLSTPTLTATNTPEATLLPFETLAPTDAATSTETPLPTVSETVTPGIVRGHIVLQGRKDADGVIIYTQNDMEFTVRENKRAFSISLPPGNWTLVFQRTGYLPQQKNVIVESNLTTQIENITLYGGDVNQDGSIDEADAEQIAYQFGATSEASAASDVNGDGEVNILDLALTCANFGRSAQTEQSN